VFHVKHYCGTHQILNTLELSIPLKRTWNGALVLILMLRWIINNAYVHIIKWWESNLVVMTIFDKNFLKFHILKFHIWHSN
jgi:hypothetical protein